MPFLRKSSFKVKFTLYSNFPFSSPVITHSFLKKRINNSLLNQKFESYDQKKIFSKNFLIFLMMLHFFFKKDKNINSSVSFFILPKRCNNYTMLRAPFRHKLAKKHYSVVRYKLICTLKLNFFKNLNFLKNFSSSVKLIEFLKNKFIFFDSNICYQSKLSFFYKFYLNKNAIKL